MRYNRTQASRLVYRLSCFAIIVGFPLWLKAMTLITIHPKEDPHYPWEPYGRLEFEDKGLGRRDSCTTCDGFPNAVRWDVKVKLHNVTARDNAQYVILYTALKWEGPWWQSSQPSLMNAVTAPNASMEVCRTPPAPVLAPSQAPTTLEEVSSRPRRRRLLRVPTADGGDAQKLELPTHSPSPTPHDRAGGRAVAGRLSPPIRDLQGVSGREGNKKGQGDVEDGGFDEGDDGEQASKNANEQQGGGVLGTVEDDLGQCCLGQPGRAYVVACVVGDFQLFAHTRGQHVAGPPFDDRCVAVAGACGGSCGTAVGAKSLPHCTAGGAIPEFELVSSLCDGDATGGQGGRGGGGGALGTATDDSGSGGDDGGGVGPSDDDDGNGDGPGGSGDDAADDIWTTDDGAGTEAESEADSASKRRLQGGAEKEQWRQQEWRRRRLRDCGAAMVDDYERVLEDKGQAGGSNRLTEGDVFELPWPSSSPPPSSSGGGSQRKKKASTAERQKAYWTQTHPAWHAALMWFLFMVYLSTVVGFAPGAGLCGVLSSERLPTLHTLHHCSALVASPQKQKLQPPLPPSSPPTLQLKASAAAATNEDAETFDDDDCGIKCISFSSSSCEDRHTAGNFRRSRRNKLLVLRNLLGKVSATFLHQSAHSVVDFFLDEESSPGTYALWDSLATLMDVPANRAGGLEDTLGLAKHWSARLRDPSELVALPNKTPGSQAGGGGAAAAAEAAAAAKEEARLLLPKIEQYVHPFDGLHEALFREFGGSASSSSTSKALSSASPSSPSSSDFSAAWKSRAKNKAVSTGKNEEEARRKSKKHGRTKRLTTTTTTTTNRVGKTATTTKRQRKLLQGSPPPESSSSSFFGVPLLRFRSLFVAYELVELVNALSGADRRVWTGWDLEPTLRDALMLGDSSEAAGTGGDAAAEKEEEGSGGGDLVSIVEKRYRGDFNALLSHCCWLDNGHQDDHAGGVGCADRWILAEFLADDEDDDDADGDGDEHLSDGEEGTTDGDRGGGDDDDDDKGAKGGGDADESEEVEESDDDDDSEESSLLGDVHDYGDEKEEEKKNEKNELVMSFTKRVELLRIGHRSLPSSSEPSSRISEAPASLRSSILKTRLSALHEAGNFCGDEDDDKESLSSSSRYSTSSSEVDDDERKHKNPKTKNPKRTSSVRRPSLSPSSGSDSGRSDGSGGGGNDKRVSWQGVEEVALASSRSNLKLDELLLSPLPPSSPSPIPPSWPFEETAAAAAARKKFQSDNTHDFSSSSDDASNSDDSSSSSDDDHDGGGDDDGPATVVSNLQPQHQQQLKLKQPLCDDNDENLLFLDGLPSSSSPSSRDDISGGSQEKKQKGTEKGGGRGGGGGGGGGVTENKGRCLKGAMFRRRHLKGLRDWVAHPAMSVFLLRWAQSLRQEVSNAAATSPQNGGKTPAGKETQDGDEAERMERGRGKRPSTAASSTRRAAAVGPFSEGVLRFASEAVARGDASALKCAKLLGILRLLQGGGQGSTGSRGSAGNKTKAASVPAATAAAEAATLPWLRVHSTVEKTAPMRTGDAEARTSRGGTTTAVTSATAGDHAAAAVAAAAAGGGRFQRAAAMATQRGAGSASLLLDDFVDERVVHLGFGRGGSLGACGGGVGGGSGGGGGGGCGSRSEAAGAAATMEVRWMYASRARRRQQDAGWGARSKSGQKGRSDRSGRSDGAGGGMEEEETLESEGWLLRGLQPGTYACLNGDLDTPSSSSPWSSSPSASAPSERHLSSSAATAAHLKGETSGPSPYTMALPTARSPFSSFSSSDTRLATASLLSSPSSSSSSSSPLPHQADTRARRGASKTNDKSVELMAIQPHVSFALPGSAGGATDGGSSAARATGNEGSTAPLHTNSPPPPQRFSPSAPTTDTTPATTTPWEAQRSCFGRVVRVLEDRNLDGRRVKFVELDRLSKHLLSLLPLLRRLYGDSDLGLELPHLATSSGPLSTKASSATSATSSSLPPLRLSDVRRLQLPMSILTPLAPCQGRSGGLNFAVRLLNEREYSRNSNRPVQHHTRHPALTLFAVFDSRHMVTPGFWEQTILHFFREADDGRVHLQPSVKYCQVPQCYVGCELSEDYFDLQREYLFRFVNCMRDGVGAVTSCGTNCVWALERGFEYEERTVLADTATSHRLLLQGFEGAYHCEKLVFGVPAGTQDLLESVFAASRGAVQLFWLALLQGSSQSSSPSSSPSSASSEPPVPFLWVMLATVVAPMALVVFSMLGSGSIARATGFGYGAGSSGGSGSASVEKDEKEEGATALADFNVAAFVWLAFAGLVAVGWPLLTSARFSHLLRYFALFDDVTHFFHSFGAYFWGLVLPGYISNTGHIPFDYSLLAVCAGALLFEVLTWLLLLELKRWSTILEGGNTHKRPKEVAILRSQQLFFVDAPLHGIAFWSGTTSAYQILFKSRDASAPPAGSLSSSSSSSSVFMSLGLGFSRPGDWVLAWLVFLVAFFSSCILSATLQIALKGISEPSTLTAFGVGILSCSCLFSLIVDPFSVLVFGRTVTVTLKHAYFMFWSVMLAIGILVFVIIPQ